MHNRAGRSHGVRQFFAGQQRALESLTPVLAEFAGRSPGALAAQYLQKTADSLSRREDTSSQHGHSQRERTRDFMRSARQAGFDLTAQRVKAIERTLVGSGWGRAHSLELNSPDQGRVMRKGREQLLSRDIRDDLKVRSDRRGTRRRSRERCSLDSCEGTSPTEVKVEEPHAERDDDRQGVKGKGGTAGKGKDRGDNRRSWMNRLSVPRPSSSLLVMRVRLS